MSSKEIHIEFTNEHVARYNGEGFKLFFAVGVGGNPTFNVVAQTYDIAPRLIISWHDEFKIAATRPEFHDGGRIEYATDPASIKFDQVYTLPSDWFRGKVTDEKLPKKSFKMVNDTDREAAAVVFKRIDGEYLPIYVSHPPIDPQGNELLTPSETVALWFQPWGESGSMVSVNKRDISTFDLSHQYELKVKFNGSKFTVV
ncbi:uncharacterized protein B0J16DRAFT_406446 [Fusarium flagelliforme]|uniref:uncharacterized protein n=1 Tax=Fusarium flagelliforme TaxID=2675880 RepID=UPI001E8DB671|nr:uncharacterized protein B0J16DRAFT_406446 [Fusarium flagelliforme]KAH7174027.1 hypothetical protein B0J16DRAFT_406446 [Fusarium flagelliforme]